MSNETALFSQLDAELSRLLSTTSPHTAAGCRPNWQKLSGQTSRNGSAVSKMRTAHLTVQENPVLRSKQGVEFLYKGEVRRLRGWRNTKGRNGRMITGYDEERGAVRSFMRKDIDRFLSIDLSETRRSTKRGDPMFKRLCTARFYGRRLFRMPPLSGFRVKPPPLPGSISTASPVPLTSWRGRSTRNANYSACRSTNAPGCWNLFIRIW